MIWIFGDSFSSNLENVSWTHILAREFEEEISIQSSNGISEFRILGQIKENINLINEGDLVIVCHTNPFRVYIPDNIPYPARLVQSHPNCDLVISDSMNRGWLWKVISKIYYKYFFDETYHQAIFDLFVEEEISLLETKTTNIIEVSGFKGFDHSFDYIFESYPGTINHMSELGNMMLADTISEILDVQLF